MPKYPKLAPLQFFATYAPLAQAACQGTGLCASVAIYQAALESGWNSSELSHDYFNFGGIKNAWDWKGGVVNFKTREVFSGKEVMIRDFFRVYTSAAHYFRGRVEFLRANPRYRKLFAVDDYASESRAMHAAGWATDPKYADSLIYGIQKYGLTKYDVVPGVKSVELAKLLFPIPAKAIQEALLHLGFDLGKAGADGVIGNMTLAAINKADTAQLLLAI
jgi:flagellum-specific peptidoglycan hydrolase FlgJ